VELIPLAVLSHYRTYDSRIWQFLKLLYFD